MNTISHQQAREWIQIRLDGQLDEAKLFALNIHLQDCAACRLYAADSERLDSELRQAYREHTQMQRSVLSQQLSTGSAVHTMNKQMRLKMKSKQIMNVATSLALVAVMAVVVLGFAWIVSTRGGMIIPGAGNDPLPTPTSTPFPWTESNPLTSTEQIASILNDLADKNVEVIQQSNWMHVVRRDQAQPGMNSTYYIESWFRFPKEDRPCTESMVWVKELPESAGIIQITIQTSNGEYGDLYQLRNGDGEVTHLEPGSSDCRLSPGITSAGILAARLQAEQAASPDKSIEVKAWYAMRENRPVFNVAVTFTQPSKGNYTGITKETHSFDLKTGAVLQEGNRMEWEDGSVFSETLQGYETEFLPELPQDIAAQFKQFSDELHAYAAGTIVRPTPTQVSQSSPGFVVYDQQFIPETNPITDGGTILQILQDLERLQIERLSKPGWYVYGPASPDPQDWMSNYYLLTHTLDQSGACEFMNYYSKDGRILPQQLVLADGRWGQISVAEEGVEPGTVTFAETGKINWSNGPMTDTCQVQNTETVSFIQNETRTFQDIVDGKTPGTYKAWTEEINGRKVFVLYYELTGTGLGNVMDPETRKLEPIDRTQTWEYFDLNWGTILSEVGERIFFLQNGKTISSAPSAEKTLDFGYTYYKELPADLKEIFEKTVADLEAYLKK